MATISAAPAPTALAGTDAPGALAGRSRRHFTASLGSLMGAASVLGLAACGGGGGGDGAPGAPAPAPGAGGGTPAPGAAPGVAGGGGAVTIALIAGQPNSATSTFEQINATGAAAKLGVIKGMAVQSDGTIWVCDNYNYTMRRITPAGVVTSPYGKAKVKGLTNGMGEAALFTDPDALCIDESSGAAVLTVGQGAEGILRSMNVTALSASTSQGVAPNTSESLNGDGAVATHAIIPSCLAAGKPEASKSVLWVGELNRLRKITNGNVTTVVPNSGLITDIVVNTAGDAFALVNVSLFYSKIIKISGGVVSLVAGGPAAAGADPDAADVDGTGAAAVMTAAAGLSIDKTTGNMFLSTNGGLRQITPAGVVTTLVPFLDLLDAYPDGTTSLIDFMVCVAPKRFIAASQSQVFSITLA
jgi:hypothetical protein